MRRSGKFYRKNEAEVMQRLGMRPTINSGSGWIEKEDGQSDELICQLKSTDAQSIRIQQKDLHTLLHNAAVTHKLPVFAIQFLQTNEVYLLVKPEQLEEVANYIQTGEYTTANEFVGIDLSEHEDCTVTTDKTIKSSSKAREKFREEYNKKFEKRRSAT